MPKPQWPIKQVKIVQLKLDEQNVRLDFGTKTPSQDSLIEDLFINEGALSLAQSIARKGLFPNDLPIVVEEGGKKVVLEGNRRVAALKGLKTPEILPKYKTTLQKYAKESDSLPGDSINVIMAPSRDEASSVISSIHTTTVRRPWSPLRQAYFYYAQVDSGKKTIEELIKEYEGVNIPKFVRMWEMHRIATSIPFEDPEVAAKVAQQSKFPISTLERIYEKEEFQKAFGISFEKTGSVQVGFENAPFLDAYKKVILDVVNKVVDSRTLNTEKEILQKVAEWSVPLAGAKKVASPGGAAAFTPIPKHRTPKATKGLAPKNIVCTLPYPAIEKMLTELKTIDYMKYPNATHDLLRTFLECSLKAYFDHKGIDPSGGKKKAGEFVFLKDVLFAAEGHFQSVRKQLVQPIKIIQGSSPSSYLFSQDYLNSINHNHNVFARGKDVKDAWDQMQPILVYILNPI